MSAETCRHCGQRIVLVNFALGASWRHQPSGSSFQDCMTEYCEQTTAAPRIRTGDKDPS